MFNFLLRPFGLNLPSIPSLLGIDIFDKLNDKLKEIFAIHIVTMLNSTLYHLSNGATKSIDYINRTPSNFMVSGVYEKMKLVHEKAIFPFAIFLFMAFLYIELIQHTTNNTDSDKSLEYIYKFVFKMIIGVLILKNSFDIASGIFAIGAELTLKINEIMGITANSITIDQAQAQSIIDALVEKDFYAFLGIFFLVIVFFISSKIVVFFVYIYTFARVFEMLMMATLSSISFSAMIGFQHRITENFVKNCISLALQGVIMIVSFAIYIALFSSISGDIIRDGTIWEYFLYPILLVVLLKNSGSIANKIIDAH